MSPFASRLSDAPRAAQRLLRERAPGLAAEITWAIRRRRGEQALSVADRFVRPGSHALDVGANWGLFSAHLARRVGAFGSVHAFEPNPAHRGTLSALARRYEQLTLHSVAVSDEPGEAELSVPVHAGDRLSALGSLAPRSGDGDVSYETHTVPVARLDDELERMQGALGFVKCDVEGLELPALKGARRLLEEARPILLVEIEERHGGAGVEATVGWLRELGYAAWCLRESGPVPYDQFDLQRDQLAHLGKGFAMREMPAEYVNDFVFAPPSVDLSSALR